MVQADLSFTLSVLVPIMFVLVFASGVSPVVPALTTTTLPLVLEIALERTGE